MDDLFWLLFLVIFIVGPLIEKVLKGGASGQRPRQQQQQQRPLPGQPPSQARLPGRQPPRPVQQRFPGIPVPEPVEETQASGEENAVDILPADLWEMLTGQRPSHGEPMRTGPAVELPERVLEAEPEELEIDRPVPVPRDERAEVDRLMRRRERELVEARTVRHEPPVIVSLESTLLPEPRRHAAFHRKLMGSAPALEVETTPGEGPAFRIDRMGRTDLQRAILMQEILGTPKGLLE